MTKSWNFSPVGLMGNPLDPSLLEILEAEIHQRGTGLVAKELPLNPIQTGMIIAVDVYSASKVLMIKSGTAVNVIFRLRLSCLAQDLKNKNLLKVKIPAEICM